MSFERWGYTVEGAWTSTDKLESRSGVYIIWCKVSEDEWKVIDVGESHDVKGRVEEHDRADCWEENCTGTLYYSAIYTPHLQQTGRKLIEQQIRNITNPPCGDR